MDTYRVVLYLHLLALLVGVSAGVIGSYSIAAGVIGYAAGVLVSLPLTRAATVTAEPVTDPSG